MNTNINTINNVLASISELQEALVGAPYILDAVEGDREAFAREIARFGLHAALEEAVLAMPESRFAEALRDAERFAEALVGLGELGDEMDEDELYDFIRSYDLVAELEDVLLQLAGIE
jgi:hypothetical protein